MHVRNWPRTASCKTHRRLTYRAIDASGQPLSSALQIDYRNPVRGAMTGGRTRPDGDCRGASLEAADADGRWRPGAVNHPFLKRPFGRSSAALPEITECSELLSAGRHCSGASSSGP